MLYFRRKLKIWIEQMTRVKSHRINKYLIVLERNINYRQQNYVCELNLVCLLLMLIIVLAIWWTAELNWLVYISYSCELSGVCQNQYFLVNKTEISIILPFTADWIKSYWKFCSIRKLLEISNIVNTITSLLPIIRWFTVQFVCLPASNHQSKLLKNYYIRLKMLNL